MPHLNPFASALALSVSAASLGLLGCSADGGQGGDQNTQPGYIGGAPGAGNVPAGVGNTPPVGAGNQPPVGAGNFPPVGAGGVPPIGGPPGGMGAGPPIGGMGAGPPIGGMGAGPPIGGSGNVGGGGPGGPGNSDCITNGVWDPNCALDSNGKLKVPSADRGFQLKTPDFMLAPGQEKFACWKVVTPNSATFAVGEWDSQMAPGSHHFILYRADSDTSATAQGVLTQSGCTQGFGGATWLYTAGSPRGHLTMPDAVAMTIKAQQRLDFDMHYINTGTNALTANIALNVNKVKAEKYDIADAEISFNIGISVPPNGTQTVMGTCPAPPGVKYFLLQTHMHHHGTDATISRVGGAMTELLVHTTNWDSPEVKLWQQAPFLELGANEHFQYTCTYKNTTSQTVTVGTSAEYNEMCMMEAYFFPATATTPTCQ